MNQNIIIKNATLVHSTGLQKANIYISDGKIFDITEKEKNHFETFLGIDATNQYVMAGMIDSHVHIRGGKFSYRESFTSGTKAAASAGITTVFEMPGCATPATCTKNLTLRIDEAKSQTYVNVGFYGGAGYDNLDDIIPLATQGVIGYKTFRMPPVVGREKEFVGLCTVSFEDLVNVMTEVYKTGLTLTIHCEDNDIISTKTEEIKTTNAHSLLDFCNSRPEEAEVNSVREAIEAARITNCKTIIAHVSSPESIKLITQAKQNNIPVFAETCAQYLYFSQEDIINHGVFARIKPPMRKGESVNELIKQFSSGEIDIIGSDHAPYTFEEKTANGDNIWKTFDGLPSLELSLPLLLNLVSENKISYETIALTTSERTAKLFGLKNKGTLEIGKDADIVIFKENLTFTALDINKLNVLCKNTAVIYDKLPLSHEITHTIIAGNITTLSTEPCSGKII